MTEEIFIQLDKRKAAIKKLDNIKGDETDSLISELTN
jgi:hypothetical protein